MNHEDAAGRRAYLALIAYLQTQRHFEILPGPHRLFFGDRINGRIWQYDVHQPASTSHWSPISASYLPVCTYLSVTGLISKITTSNPPPNIPLRQILVRNSGGMDPKRSNFGLWSQENCFLLQYNWSDDTPFLDTSTSQLRTLQVSSPTRPQPDGRVNWPAKYHLIAGGVSG